MGEAGMRPGVREAVGVFATEDDLQKAIDDLLLGGFSRADLSLLASEATVKEKLGHHAYNRPELEDAPCVPRTSYVSPETLGDAKGGLIAALVYVGAGVLMVPAASAGAGLAAIATAAVIGGGVGGGIGAVLAAILGAQRADRIAEQLAHGGLLLWVRTWDREQEQRATEILSRHSAQEVHIHEFPDTDEPDICRSAG